MINFRRTLYCITYFFSHHLCYLGLQSSVTFKVITGGAVPIIFLSRNATCLRSVHCPGLSHSHISAKMGTHTSQSCSPHLEYLHDCDSCQLPPAIRPAPSNTQTDTHTHTAQCWTLSLSLKENVYNSKEMVWREAVYKHDDRMCMSLWLKMWVSVHFPIFFWQNSNTEFTLCL